MTVDEQSTVILNVMKNLSVCVRILTRSFGSISFRSGWHPY